MTVAEQFQRSEEVEDRNHDYADEAEIKKDLLERYKHIMKGLDDQNDRAQDNSDHWDIYNCQLNSRQFYNGNAEIYVPIVRDAVNARKTRFSNQIFPRNGRYIDCVTDGTEMPYGPIALAENYVRKSGAREIIPSLLINGDVEGQYSIYVTWDRSKRHITQRVKTGVTVDEDTQDSEEQVDDVEHYAVPDNHPRIELISDSDLIVLPATAPSLMAALHQGGSVTIVRRWSKATIKRKIKEGIIDKKKGDDLILDMGRAESTTDTTQTNDKEKENVNAAGIQGSSRGKFAQVYETWLLLPIGPEKDLRISRAFFGRSDVILSAKRNPLWCDKLPLISCAVNPIPGSFKGMSSISPVKYLQYFANDVTNEGADSASYALMPIIMTDPEKNPKVGSMILSMAAVWQTSPQDTQFAKFPELWKDALEIVSNVKQQIFQTLSVNPAQITQAPTKTSGKRSQAEIASEQQVDILTVADAVSVIETGVLTPMIELFIDMDAQYRDGPTSVIQYGELGRQANHQVVQPMQVGRQMQFSWLGVESARNAQQIQQQITALNVLRGIPAELFQGYSLNLAPALVNMIEAAFGARIAPMIFQDIRYQSSSDPEEENGMLLAGVSPWVHPLDDHQRHIQIHMQLMQTGEPEEVSDPQGKIRTHIMLHMQAAAAMQAKQMQGSQGKGQPGVPGGAGRGVAGTPRQGAQAGTPRPMQQPPGAIHKDKMPLSFPRKM